MTILATCLVILLAGCSASTVKKSGAHSGSNNRTAVGDTRSGTTTRVGSTGANTAGITAASAPKKSTRTQRDGKTGARTHAAASADWVSALGDSVMLGAADNLEQQIPNLSLIDAQGSRQLPAAVYILRRERAAGYLGDAVVVDVGNNGPISAAQFDRMMGVLKGVRKVLVVNLTIPTYVAKDEAIAVPNNAVLAEGVRRYPKQAVLVDWHAASEGHPEYFWDGIHLTPQGAQAYARLISSRLGGLKERDARSGFEETFSYGEGGASGECVGPPPWCRTIISP